MAVRSARLYGPLTVGAGPTVVYTCPAGKTAIFKDLSFTNTSLLAQTVTLYINGNSAGQAVHSQSVAGGSTLVLTGRFIVLEPGDTLRVGYSGTGGASSGSGAELQGVA